MLHHQPMCEVCGQQAATIFITCIVGGEARKQNLCQVCARVHTQGEEWLQAMAKKFGLPPTASFEDVLQGITDGVLPVASSDEIDEEESVEFDESDISEFAALMEAIGEDVPNVDDSPNLILEANFEFSAEFPADENDADDLDEAWSDEAWSDEEISLEALKASWQSEESTQDNTPPAFKDIPKEKDAVREIVAQRCPKCGTTWDRLREDGRAGCAQCYVAFHDRLIEVMSRMQREAQHIGKTPREAQRRRRRLEHLRARRDHRLEMLSRRLAEAVAGEKYEDAAQLRDKIKMVASTIVNDEM